MACAVWYMCIVWFLRTACSAGESVGGRRRRLFIGGERCLGWCCRRALSDRASPGEGEGEGVVLALRRCFQHTLRILSRLCVSY